MRCAWKELLAILPPWMRPGVDRLCKEGGQEIRLRLGYPPELVTRNGRKWLDKAVTKDDLIQCINNASRYSPWNAVTASKGYLTAPGGHRIGICGEAIIRDGMMSGIREPGSLCIRIARDFPGIAGDMSEMDMPQLIIGAPGWGKTTLLRDVIRLLSERGEHIAVIDERGELFPDGFSKGRCTDVILGCPKTVAMDSVLRTMGPDWIAVDEITAKEDCEALIGAANCGVKLLATAHAGSLMEFRSRSIYRPLLEHGIFPSVWVLRQDKTWKRERIAK